MRGVWISIWAVACVVCGVAGSCWAWHGLTELEEEALETRFAFDARWRERAILERFDHAFEAVESISSFVTACPHVTSRGFAVFAAPILERHKYIQALSWNAYVRRGERGDFEAAMRAELNVGYRITERSMSGMITAGARDEHVAVAYIEPHAGNENALGYDVASEPKRSAALRRARDTGRLAITERIILVQEQGREQRYACLAFIPKYIAGTSAATEHDRRANLEGFVVGVLRIGDIVDDALASLDKGIDTLVIDDSALADEQLLYAHPANHARGFVGALTHTSLAERGGRRWRLLFQPTAAYLARYRSWTPLAALGAGLFITALLAAGIIALGGRARRVQKLVAQRTVELSDTNRELAAEIEQRRRVEAELKRHRDLLDATLAERTAALVTANDSLRESEERLRLTLGAVTDGGWDWNVATGEIYFSDSWLASLGYRREDVEPHVRFWESLVHPDDMPRVREVLAQHFDGRTVRYECENRLRTKSGDYRWNLDRGKVVSRDEEGRPLRMVGTDTDITDRVRAAEDKRRFEEKVQHAQKLESLGVLAGGIAHDFNNLLVGILGGADLLIRGLPVGSPSRDRAEQLRLAAVRASELTQQMLAYAGSGQFAVETVELSGLVEEMGGLLHASISKKAVLEYDLASEAVLVDGDPTRLRQVVMNLITNASEGLDGKEGRITVRTERVDADRTRLDGTLLGGDLEPGRYASMTVADDGAGMDEETCARIFDPFFSTKFQGRGLGLAAVLGIVRSHGGTIDVRSKPARGTTVSVFLPCSAAPLKAPAAPDPAETCQGSGTVLVVEDEEGVRAVAEQMLLEAGFDVLTATDGVEGVSVFRRQPERIAVVLLDMTMPRMNGLEALREMRRIRPDVRVVLTSGYSATLERSADNEATSFIQKPYGFQELLAAVRSALGRRAAGTAWVRREATAREERGARRARTTES